MKVVFYKALQMLKANPLTIINDISGLWNCIKSTNRKTENSKSMSFKELFLDISNKLQALEKLSMDSCHFKPAAVYVRSSVYC